MDLNFIWFLLLGFLFIGYAILDGFDFGVGIVHLFVKGDRERRLLMNAIGPVWDGNEVWLITAGGAMFAAFPILYATFASAMYHAVMLLLLALICRAVSMEFRSKIPGKVWRKSFDLMFEIGSLLAALLFGVAFGNILHGMPINEAGEYTGNFFTLLNPYSVVIGLLTVILFVMHGALYLTMKVDGRLQEQMVKIASGSWIAVVVMYIIATFFSFFDAGYLFEGVLDFWLFYVIFIILLAAIMFVPIMLNAKRFFYAFLSSSTVIASMLGLAGISLFPRVMPSNLNLDYSLTINNASSSQLTLWVMFIITLLGMPLVIGYTIFIYRTFKGRVELDDSSY
ncbi:cytochrome d ubiquinol oxidase subunit II [bacterium]|nr:cytochrome d ubiquinol oxidase subunit II [bacterium]